MSAIIMECQRLVPFITNCNITLPCGVDVSPLAMHKLRYEGEISGLIWLGILSNSLGLMTEIELPVSSRASALIPKFGQECISLFDCYKTF